MNTAMKVFIAALDEGSLAGAGRQPGSSPAAVCRAIAFLEQQVSAPPRSTERHAIKLTEIGERYAVDCRRALFDLLEAEAVAGGEQAAPRGSLGGYFVSTGRSRRDQSSKEPS